MWNFSNRPPEDAVRPGMRLLRAPPKGSLVGVVLSDDLIGLYTHYAGGRTRPCPGVGCDNCAHQISKRWHAWLAFQEAMTKETCILEITAQAAEQFLEHKQKWKTLRACQFKIGRPSGTPNGRVLVLTDRWKEPPEKLPPSPNVEAALFTIWGITNNVPLYEPRITTNSNGELKLVK